MRSEVQQRTRQAIDFVNDHAVDVASLDVGEQARWRRRAYHVGCLVKPPSS